MNTFGTRLREARKAANLTQKELAKKAGVSQTTISDAERGRNAGSTEAATLAAVLKVEPIWLTDGKGPRTRDQTEFKPPAINEPEAPYAVTALAPKSRHETRIDEIVALLQQTDMDGLAVILDRAKDAARDYPLVKQTPASSQ